MWRQVFMPEGRKLRVIMPSFTYFRKVHKIFMVMVFPSRNCIFLIIKFHFPENEIKQVIWYFTIIYEANQLSFFSFLKAMAHFLYQTFRNIIINIKFCIAGYLNRICFIMIIIEIKE